jgi:glycosyltransferase involved in cell wall biosynthesis
VRVALIGPGTLSIPPQGWGATERVVWNIHQRARDAGFETVIVNTKDPDEISEQCARFAPDLIHLHYDLRLRHCLPYLIAHPTPLVTTCHDPRLPTELPPEVAPSIDLADAVIALSPTILERLRSRRDAVHYVPNGVDTGVFRPLAKKPNTVAGVGKNTARKKFVEIAKFFAARPEYQLTLCGPDMRARPGGRWPVIPTAPNVTLLDNQPESAVARLLGESQFFVHLCDVEASTLVVREAMACGCAVWTVPVNAQDVRNVALSWDQAVTDRDLGARAAREAMETFDWSIIVRRHAEVYAQTLERWRASATAAEVARDRYRALQGALARQDRRLDVVARRLTKRVRRRVAAGLGWLRRRGGS